MSVLSLLSGTCEAVEGGFLCTLMTLDGIPVESSANEGICRRIETNSLMADVADSISQLRRSLIESGHSGPEEMVICTDQCSVIIRPIGDQHLLALAIEPGGSIGKGRHALKMSAAGISL